MISLWNKLRREPWIWSFLAAIGVWLATITYTGGHGAGEILTAALSFATFSIIVGLGQMMVITTGPGNVDLSIPATITLSGVVAMKVMDTDTARLLLGVGAALGVSFLVGIFNYGLIRLLRIPPHRHSVVKLSRAFNGYLLWPGIRIKPPLPLDTFATTRFLEFP